VLETFQLITVIQGLFLIIILFKTKNKYYEPAFWLLVGSITSVIFYILGDDDNNPFIKHINVFFFDKSLFITFLFLFIKYQYSQKTNFTKLDYLYFIPNILFFIIEFLESNYSEGLLILDIPELILEFIFLSYLLQSFYVLFKQKINRWMLIFLTPLILLVGYALINEILYWFTLNEIVISDHEHFGSYTIILIALLFYGIAFKLVISPEDILPSTETKKYKNSNLNEELIAKYRTQLIELMEQEDSYKDPLLSIQKVSEKLEIPRQYISEILNVHMDTSFQDFVNNYRVEAFIDCLEKDQYNHLTLMGIANEVGFNSKSTFYTYFKKIKGLTPLEYKKKHVLKV
tara:strand:- start:8109 stop:9143 length:1035 start_codon:yes stop_codon:yes gene_type:complete